MRSVARRYARALVSYLTDKGIDPDPTMGILKEVSELLNRNRDVRMYLTSPVVSKNEKLAFAKEFFGSVNLPDYLLNFMLLLVEKGRIGIFDLVYDELIREVDRLKGRARGVLKVAVPLDDESIEGIKKTLEDRLKKEVVLDLVIDPSIIGGAIAEIDGYVFDGSILRNLEQIKEKMIEG